MEKRYLTLVLCFMLMTFTSPARAEKLENISAGSDHLIAVAYPFGIEKETNKKGQWLSLGNIDWLLSYYYGVKSENPESPPETTTAKEGIDGSTGGDSRGLLSTRSGGWVANEANQFPGVPSTPAQQNIVAAAAAGTPPFATKSDPPNPLQYAFYQPSVIVTYGTVSASPVVKKKDQGKNAPAASNTPAVATSPLVTVQPAATREKTKENPIKNSPVVNNAPTVSASAPAAAAPVTVNNGTAAESKTKDPKKTSTVPGKSPAVAESAPAATNTPATADNETGQPAAGRDKGKNDPKKYSSAISDNQLADAIPAGAGGQLGADKTSHGPATQATLAHTAKLQYTESSDGLPNKAKKKNRAAGTNDEEVASAATGISATAEPALIEVAAQNVIPPALFIQEGIDSAQPGSPLPAASPAPVPEPATMLLISASLAGLAAGRLRRPKKGSDEA